MHDILFEGPVHVPLRILEPLHFINYVHAFDNFASEAQNGHHSLSTVCHPQDAGVGNTKLSVMALSQTWPAWSEASFTWSRKDSVNVGYGICLWGWIIVFLSHYTQPFDVCINNKTFESTDVNLLAIPRVQMYLMLLWLNAKI